MKSKALVAFILLTLSLPVVANFAFAYVYERGNETIDVYPSYGSPYLTYVNITLENFEPAKTVEIYFGSFKVATARINSTGQAEVKNLQLPELPGGTLLVTARIPDKGVVTSTTFDVEPYIELLDKQGNPVESYNYLGDGDILRIRGFGFLPGEVITIEDDATGDYVNPIEDGRVVSVVKGTLKDTYILADERGSFDLSYQLKVTVSAGDTVYVVVNGMGTEYETGSGSFDASFKAAGPVTITLYEDEYIAEPGDEITIYVSDAFDGLREDKLYQLMIDRSRLSLTVDGEDARWFTALNDTVTFEVPNLSSGVHSFALVYYGSSTPVAEHLFVITKPGGSPGMAIVRTEDGEPMPYTVDKVVYDGEYCIVGWNFEEYESVYVYMYTPDDPNYYVGTLDIGDKGGGVEYFIPPELPSGKYAIYLEREYGEAPSVVVEMVPSAEIYPEEGYIGDVIDLSFHGLEPNTGYIVVWDVLGEPTPLENMTFVTDEYGTRDGITIEVPVYPAGEYAISVAPVDSPDSPVEIYNVKGEVSYPEFEIKSEVKFNPAGEYIPYQLVSFTWEIGRDPAPEGELVVITIDDTPVFNGIIGEDLIQASSTSATVLWEDGTIKGSFIMPNGDPGDLLFKISAGGDEAAGSIKRVSGAGAMLVGVDIANDIAYLKTTCGEIKASLSSLSPTIEDIEGDVVYLRTKMGDVVSTLEALDATITATSQDIATISTTLGTVSTKIDNVASLITSSSEDVVNRVKKALSTVEGSVSDLGSRIDSLSDDVSEVKGTISAIPSQISSLNANVKNVNAALSDITNYIYVLMTLVAIAIILAIIGIVRR